MKRGFTLIELSIVLVIVGLLIGGILVGQSLVDTAKWNKQFSEWRQMEVAAVLYKQKYKHLPGDDPRVSIPGHCCSRGNGDGYIQLAQPVHVNGAEKSFFFYTLKAYNMFFQKLQSPQTSGGMIVKIGDDMPAFMNRDDVYYTVSAFCDYNGVCYKNNHNYLSFGPAIKGLTNSDFWGFNWPNLPLTAKEAMIIDQKLDDGLPFAGDITAATNWGNNPPVLAGSGCVTIASKYNAGYLSKSCNLYIKLGF